GPGFTVDEPLPSLGGSLVLPPDLEARRGEIEAVLPAFALPGEPRAPRRELSFVHRFVAGSSPRTLVLLHGEGGDETSLLALAREADHKAPLLALRGHELESGRPSFVRLGADGSPDMYDLRLAARELESTVAEAAALYDFDAAGAVLVGHAGGALLALTALLAYPGTFAAAALLRPRTAPAPASGDGPCSNTPVSCSSSGRATRPLPRESRWRPRSARQVPRSPRSACPWVRCCGTWTQRRCAGGSRPAPRRSQPLGCGRSVTTGRNAAQGPMSSR